MARNVRVVTDTRVLRGLIRDCDGKPTRILHDGVDYGIYQEFGTSRGVPPHPFMTPALEAVRNPFLEGLKQVANLRKADDFVELIARRAQAIARDRAPYDTGALKNSIDVHKPNEFLGTDE